MQYFQARKKEEKIVRKKSARIKEIKTNLKKYGLSDKKLTPQDIAKFDQEDKKKKKPKEIKLSTEELDLDQEPKEEGLTSKKIKKPKKKK